MHIFTTSFGKWVVQPLPLLRPPVAAICIVSHWRECGDALDCEKVCTRRLIADTPHSGVHCVSVNASNKLVLCVRVLSILKRDRGINAWTVQLTLSTFLKRVLIGDENSVRDEVWNVSVLMMCSNVVWWWWWWFSRYWN